MGKSIKMEQLVALDQLPEVLVQIADGIKGEGVQAGLFGGGMEFKKLKLSVKNEYGQALVKVSIKPADPKIEASGAAAAPASGKESYKKLKKRMKSSFKVLRTAVKQSMLPPEAAVREFLADSASMITFKGYGDEFYDEYEKACKAFEQAYAEKDLAAVAGSLDALSLLESRCHDLYK